MYPGVSLQLPKWIEEEVGDGDRRFPTIDERMALTIRLAERNITEGGGPFGAGIFEIETGRLVAPGVNLVVPLVCSLAHAEAMAIAVAQQVYNSHDLGLSSLPPMELVTSAQPCIQCYGILWWSGLKRVVIGANKDDVERITGFVEGPLPEDWRLRLEDRPPLEPIAVITDVLRANARDVLKRYRDLGGRIYNPSSSECRSHG